MGAVGSADDEDEDFKEFALTSPTEGGNAHTRLLGLLDYLESSEPGLSPVPAALPEDSQRLFDRFIRGYSGMSAMRQRSPTAAAGAAAAGAGTAGSSPRAAAHGEPLTPAGRAGAYLGGASAAAATAGTSGGGGGAAAAEDKHLENQDKAVREHGDHYEYFARLPADAASGVQDRTRRLQGKRLQHRRGQVQLCAEGRSDSRNIKYGLDDLELRWRKGGTWGAATTALKAELRTREACESLRFLVFGTTASEGKAKDSVAAYEQKCGSREEVVQLHKVWDQMDEDGSGDVEFQEFISFFSRNKADRLLGMRCVNYLIGKAKDEGAEERETGCSIQDMMRLIWLRATDEDVAQMMHWFNEAEYHRDEVPTPPLLSKRKRREILENFPALQGSPTGKVSFQELLESGFVDEVTLKGLREHFERVGPWDLLTERDLLEMMCPRGYRAHVDVRTAVDLQGRPLVWVSNKYFTGWLLAGKASARHECQFGQQDAKPEVVAGMEGVPHTPA